MGVVILLGSASDKEIAEKATAILRKLGVPVKSFVASAHRSPARVDAIIAESGADVFIAAAGVSAALPGVVAAKTLKPVIGVPVSGKVNMDAILSVVQMPPGVPVAAVGLDRGENAGLLAARILALKDAKVAAALEKYRAEMESKVIEDSKQVEAL